MQQAQAWLQPSPSPTESGPEVATDYLQSYNQAGALPKKTVDYLLKEVGKPQSLEAMRSLLGSPARVSRGVETYDIAGSSDGVLAPRQLIVLYRLDPKTNYQTSQAYDWYVK